VNAISVTQDLATGAVGIIIARGGSKRLPRKNVRHLAGKPLIAYTVEAARQSLRLARFIVSTDDPEIAQIATASAAVVPFLRPTELAEDKSSAVDVLQHAISWLESQGRRIETVVLLQATSPFRTGKHIDEAIDLFEALGVDTVTSVTASIMHPYWHWQPDGVEMKPFFSTGHIAMSRQELPPALIENGAVYVLRREVLDSGSLYGRRVAGYLMSSNDSIDVDTQDDFDYAEFLMSRRRDKTG
jgi:N-acylneuraminate cytidylyltransferase/CMP-N,N'-diacetyllegionaminic acid synthase